MILTDTNIFVYAYDPTDGMKRTRALATIERLESRHIGALSPQILGEFYVNATRKIPSPLTPEEAHRRIAAYLRFWTVYSISPQVVAEALRACSGFNSRTGMPLSGPRPR